MRQDSGHVHETEGGRVAAAATDWDRFLARGLANPAALREFLVLTSRLCGDVSVSVYLRAEGGDMVTGGQWRCAGTARGEASADGVDVSTLDGALLDQLDGRLSAADGGTIALADPPVVAARLAGTVRDGAHPTVVAAKPGWGSTPDSVLEERLGIACRAPELPLLRARLADVQRDLARLGSCLDLTAQLGRQRRFLGAAFVLVNELASRFKCDRVSLGWMKGSSIELRAVSHTEKIEPKTQLARAMAAAMEESVDQGIEVVWPADPDSAVVSRDHRLLAEGSASRCLASVPILVPRAEAGREFDPREDAGERFVGAILLERDGPPFATRELEDLRLAADQSARLLDDLHRHDRWIGARAAARVRESAAGLLGPSHTGWKLLGITLAAALAVGLFVRKEYRVEAPFTLETDSVAFVASPFEGFIADVSAEPGDEVKESQRLFSLDDRELLLQLQAADAEVARFSGEAVRAEAEGNIAEMRLARARLAQAESRRDLVRYRLGQAEITAPFNGVVVEGDLRERINAPVKQGETLMKIARIEGLYPELKVAEEDIGDLAPGSPGRMILATRPDEPFSITVEDIVPVARTGETGNTFTVRCRFDGTAPEWWRPGMSGIAKTDAGERSLFWIATHRTIDRLRLLLW